MKLPANPNLIYMGTPEFALSSLRHLIQHHYEISAVITQPDRPKGRGRKISPPPIKETALNHGIRVLQPERVSAESLKEQIKALRPDLIIVVAYGQVLEKAFLDIPAYGTVNVHASLLPKYRGASPIQHAILNQEPETGLTIMHMDEGLDTGPILLQERVAIMPDETAGHLHDRLADRSGPLTIRFLREAAAGRIQERVQDSSQAVYAPKIKKEQAFIPWQETSSRISAMIRAYDPIPGARTMLQGKELKLFHPRITQGISPNPVAGRVAGGGNGGLFIETGDGVIEIGEVQYSGKKRMPSLEFLRGFSLSPGTRLGV